MKTFSQRPRTSQITTEAARAPSASATEKRERDRLLLCDAELDRVSGGQNRPAPSVSTSGG